MLNRIVIMIWPDVKKHFCLLVNSPLVKVLICILIMEENRYIITLTNA